MLFNSYAFMLGFLPITAALFFLIARASQRLAAGWLFAASLFFYGWWDWRFVGLLLGSILFNYCAGMAINRSAGRRRRLVLAAAIVANLGCLAYFKYSGFFLETVAHLAGVALPIPQVVLPLGISFFTFTQIAFLVDVSRGLASEPDLVHYGLFVTYFPHLIAGPVLHHEEMMPQFARRESYAFDWENLSVGLTVFLIGLFKKVVLADTFADYATPVFGTAAEGGNVPFFNAWSAALSYTLQLYFDFSGYSDMAIGISLMFGIRLPLNFDSPYKSTSIIEFWQRWHMTLSRFLRDYLYVPLGGNRRGTPRRYFNLAATMLLGGLWHGAGWTFVAWGALHGTYLIANHAWRGGLKAVGRPGLADAGVARALAAAATFLAVVFAWVFFRAANLDAALRIVRGMLGLRGFLVDPDVYAFLDLGHQPWADRLGVFKMSSADPVMQFERLKEFVFLLAGLGMCWLLPNTQEIMARYRPALRGPRSGSAGRLAWRPSPGWVGVVFVIALCAFPERHRVSEFLYFQF